MSLCLFTVCSLQKWQQAYPGWESSWTGPGASGTPGHARAESQPGIRCGCRKGWSVDIWVASWRCGCLVTWFCYQLIAKPGNKTATPPWPNLYQWDISINLSVLLGNLLQWIWLQKFSKMQSKIFIQGNSFKIIFCSMCVSHWQWCIFRFVFHCWC